MTSKNENSIKYRPEIDGLRAIAVLSVIFFHANFRNFQGGFLGVDVFFVLSGYLITSILHTAQLNNSLNLLDFYARRIKRILPSLFLVMLLISPICWILLLPEEMKSFSKSLIYIPLYLSNIFFHKESNYFDVTNDLKPLIHTWSLSIEEQFYLILPPLLVLANKIKVIKKELLIFLLLIASFFVAEFIFKKNPSANFYFLTSRAWEFLFGSLLAIYSVSNKVTFSQTSRNIISFIGLTSLLMSIYFFNENTTHPSSYTLIPVISTCLIIHFGTIDTACGKFLSSKILVGIGLISYSLYLWHQPIYVFLRIFNLGDPSQTQYVISIALVFVLSYMCWRFYESPIRKSKLNNKNVYILALCISIFFIFAGAVGSIKDGFPERYSLSPNFQKIFSDKEYLGCNNQNPEFPCTVGEATKTKIDIAIFGDSHSGVMLPAFDLLGKERNLKIIRIGAGGCPPILNTYVLKGHREPSYCKEIALKQFKFVRENNIKNIVLIAKWQSYANDSNLGEKANSKRNKAASFLAFKNGLKTTVEKYQSLGVKVWIMYQAPQQSVSVNQLYYKLSNDDLNDLEKSKLIASYSIPYEKHMMNQLLSRDAIDSTNSFVINPDKILCGSKTCLAGTPSEPFYRDKDHLTPYGALLLKSLLIDSLAN